MPFQIKAIEQSVTFLRTKGSVYNACEQGLGKCLMAISTIDSITTGFTLIICPAVMVLTWRDEINKWIGGAIIRTVTKGSDVETAIEEMSMVGSDDPADEYIPKYLILSYNLATTHINKLASFNWNVLVLDEAHYVKNPKSQRTKAIMLQLWHQAHYHIALSGTPFTKCVTDGFTLFNKMAPKIFPNYYSFANKFAIKEVTPWATNYKGVRNPEKLSKLLRENFFVRYRKEEVLPELPAKRWQNIILPEEYDVAGPEKLTREEVTALLERLEVDKDTVSARVQTYRRLQGLAKAEAVIAFVKDLLEQDIPVVLFGYHLEVLSAYLAAFEEYNPAVITGETSQTHRHNEVTRFQEGKTNLFIGQMVAAGVGITLTRASNVVLGELSYSPTDVFQAVDRCHRIGQKDSVNIYNFIVDKSIDHDVVNILIDKASSFKQVLG